MNDNRKNPFNDFDIHSLMKLWTENPAVKSMMNSDMAKKIQEEKWPEFDKDAIIAAQKKNLDALKDMNAKAAENISQMAERQTALMNETLKGIQSQTEEAAKNGGQQFEQTYEEAQERFKAAMKSATDWGDEVKNAGNEAYEVAAKHMKKSLEEFESLAKRYRNDDE